MNAIEHLNKEGIRDIILEIHYDNQADFCLSRHGEDGVIKHISQNTNIESDEIDSAFNYLIEAGLMEMKNAAGDAKITYRGVKEVEKQMVKKKQNNRHQILNYLYRKLEGSSPYMDRSAAVSYFVENNKMTSSEVDEALLDLKDEDLIKGMNYNTLTITPTGRRKVESLIESSVNSQTKK